MKSIREMDEDDRDFLARNEFDQTQLEKRKRQK
eukprot:CAMPEP_0170472582 /NCGR_PEP_ID=MMETSP0123-20130129/14599_1 /TAXON_ID=182087 /ORGANISM="Favella ehrenbergii, Strain Fehren 1" /LENGTH=32 /DNA_ID= /DNA_START= /DNA_END= /DNA_ORIENTATION=